MIAVLVAQALAGGVERYPLLAEVALPAEGPVRVRVPPGLRTAADPVDGSDLLLLDAAGAPVAFARVEGDPGWREAAAVAVAATADPRVFRLDPDGRAIDEIEVSLPHGVPAATVTVRADGAVLAGPEVVYDLPGGRRREIRFAPTGSEVSVEVVPTTGRLTVPPAFLAWRRAAPAVAPDRIEVPVGAPWIQENGFVRYEVRLERALPIDRVTLRATDLVWERQAEAQALPWHQPPDAQGGQLWPGATVPIRRIALGTTGVELATIPGPPSPTDRLAVLVSAQGQPPLDVPSVVAELDGVELVVLEPGPGPHTLYGGAPPGTSPPWDLQVAAPELARAASIVVAPGPVADNPAWVSPEARANLAAPGSELPTDRFAWRRPVEGTGLARIPLPVEVLSTARPDLGDLRLATDGGRQVPYVLRRRPSDTDLEVEVRRLERPRTSVLRVALPEEGVPISTVTLATAATVFERRVIVSRVRGTGLEPLRAITWVGRDRPMALSIDVSQPVGRELVVEIENGDDPPLPIDEVTVRAGGWELVAVLPEGGASLLYGAPAEGAPSYDLALLSTELVARAASEATVGERERAGRKALGALDRVLLAIGIGVLALGLLGLAADLLRKLPEAPA